MSDAADKKRAAAERAERRFWRRATDILQALHDGASLAWDRAEGGWWLVATDRRSRRPVDLSLIVRLLREDLIGTQVEDRDHRIGITDLGVAHVRRASAILPEGERNRHRRQHDPLDWLEGRGLIKSYQRRAAGILRADVEAATIPSARAVDPLVERVDVSRRPGVVDTEMLDARERVVAALVGLPPILWRIVVAVVIECRPLAEAEGMLGLSRRAGKDVLAAALDVVAIRYGIVNRADPNAVLAACLGEAA